MSFSMINLHSVANSEVCDTITELNDGASNVRAKYGWEVSDQDAERLDLPLDRVQCGRLDANKHFSRCWLGHVEGGELEGSSNVGDYECFLLGWNGHVN